jgi:hypothetical protein
VSTFTFALCLHDESLSLTQFPDHAHLHEAVQWHALTDATPCASHASCMSRQCRALVWSTMLKPRYYDQGVDSFWLDETDGEGTGGGDGDYGYNTSYGPAPAYSNLWVNDWLSMYSEPVAAQPGQKQPPLVLTRGVWAGGQRHGVVLWSSDIHSSFEQLASQVRTAAPERICRLSADDSRLPYHLPITFNNLQQQSPQPSPFTQCFTIPVTQLPRRAASGRCLRLQLINRSRSTEPGARHRSRRACTPPCRASRGGPLTWAATAAASPRTTSPPT